MNLRNILFLLFAVGASAPAADLSPADLYVTNKVWVAHLTVKPDQWKIMQPIEVDRRSQRRANPEKASKNGYLASQGTEFPWGHGDLEFEGQVFHDVGVRFKGNGTFLNAFSNWGVNTVKGAERVPYKIHLNEFVKGQKLGTKITSLDFRNNITDASWMNEVLALRMYRDAKVPSSRTAYARLYLTVPGKVENRLIGLYGLTEDIGTPFLEERFDDGNGALLKPYDRSFEGLFKYRGENWLDYVQALDPKNQVSPADRKRIIEFCALVSKASDTDFTQRLGSYVDLDELARFMAVTAWLSDGDNIMDNGQNFYVYLNPKTQKLVFMPWDLDHTFGQFPQHLNQKQRESRSIFEPWYHANPFLARVFKVPVFRTLYMARMEEFSKTLFDPARLAAQVDDLAPHIRPAVSEQAGVTKTDILERFDKAIAGRSLELREYGDGEIVPIKTFAVRRAKFVNGQLALKK